MIRIREISDPDLRERIRDLLREQRGVSVPDWYELDDADYVDLLNALRDRERGLDDDMEGERDPRM